MIEGISLAPMEPTTTPFTYVYRYEAPYRKRHASFSRKEVGYSNATKWIVHGIYRRLRKQYGLPVSEARHMVTMLLSMGMSCGSQEHHDMVMRAFRNSEAKSVA